MCRISSLGFRVLHQIVIHVQMIRENEANVSVSKNISKIVLQEYDSILHYESSIRCSNANRYFILLLTFSNHNF